MSTARYNVLCIAHDSFARSDSNFQDFGLHSLPAFARNQSSSTSVLADCAAARNRASRVSLSRASRLGEGAIGSARSSRLPCDGRDAARKTEPQASTLRLRQRPAPGHRHCRSVRKVSARRRSAPGHAGRGIQGPDLGDGAGRVFPVCECVGIFARRSPHLRSRRIRDVGLLRAPRSAGSASRRR